MKDKVANIYLGNGKRIGLKYDGALAAASPVDTATINAAIVAYWQHVGDGTMYLTLDDYLTAMEAALGSKRSSIIQTALAFHAGRQNPYPQTERDTGIDYEDDSRYDA